MKSIEYSVQKPETVGDQTTFFGHFQKTFSWLIENEVATGSKVGKKGLDPGSNMLFWDGVVKMFEHVNYMSYYKPLTQTLKCSKWQSITFSS